MNIASLAGFDPFLEMIAKLVHLGTWPRSTDLNSGFYAKAGARMRTPVIIDCRCCCVFTKPCTLLYDHEQPGDGGRFIGAVESRDGIPRFVGLQPQRTRCPTTTQDPERPPSAARCTAWARVCST